VIEVLDGSVIDRTISFRVYHECGVQSYIMYLWL
jgi:hypothetical protein